MANRRPMSVVQWLESLSLDQFRNEFLFNGYTELHHLCTITESDLNCIGITQRGYQKRILQHLPTEAEATLSEFGYAPPEGGGKPTPPPRRGNGNTSDTRMTSPKSGPSFDDDSYLHVSPAEIKKMVETSFNPGNTRSSGGRASVPEVPKRNSPQVPPRRSIEPTDESSKPKPVPRERKSPPPPLPERNNEKGDIPIPIPRKRVTQIKSSPPSIEPVLPDTTLDNPLDQMIISTNPFSGYDREEQEEYDEPQKLINVESLPPPPPTTTSSAFNPFNPFINFPDSSDLNARLQDRPVPLPPQPSTSDTTVTTTSLEQPPIIAPDLFRRPVPQPPGMEDSGMGHATIRSLPDGSPASSPEGTPLEDNAFEFPPPPPPPRVQNSRSPPLMMMTPLIHNDIPPPVEDLEECPLRSPSSTVPLGLDIFDPIANPTLLDRELPPPPPPPSQRDAEESLMQRLKSRPVPQPPSIPPRNQPPPAPPRVDNIKTDLIDIPASDFDPSFNKHDGVRENSLEEINGKFKLNQSFDDNQSMRSKDSPDSGLGFLQDNQSDHSHQSDQSSSHHSDLIHKRDSIDSLPPMLPPKSSLSSQSLNSRSSQSISSHGSQTPSLPPPLERDPFLESNVQYPNYAKGGDSIDECEYDFLRDAETGREEREEARRLSEVYLPLSEATSNRPLSEVEYLTLAEAETRPVSIFGQPTQPPPPPPSHSTHRMLDRDPNDPRASYLKLSDATSGDPYEGSNAKALPPIPSEPYERSPSPSIDEPLRPARRAPPPPPTRNSDTAPTPVPRTSAPPGPKYAHVNKGFIADSTQSSPTPTPMNYDGDEDYDELRMVSPVDIPPHHGSFSSFREFPQSEDSESEDELLDDYTDSGETDDSVPSLPERNTSSPVSQEFRNGLEEKLKRTGGQFAKKERRRSQHSRSIDDQTRRRLDATLTRLQQSIPKEAVEVIEKSGFLWKQGGEQGNKGFRKRWVVFRNNELRYYESDKKMNETKKIIPVGAMRNVENLCGIARITDSKPNRITLETIGRKFQFAAETCDEGTLWANILMKAILLYEPPPGGFPVGGDMSCPDKEGYLKMEGSSQKKYIAIKGETMCYYNSKSDFESAIPLTDIPMKLASVKDIGRNKIQLFTPSKVYVLTADSPKDVNEWVEAMKGSIAEGLSDHTVIAKVWENANNKFCAECGMRDPDWASINFGVVVCKQCSGFHRELGVHMSKVRSLKMDVKVWTDELIQLMLDLGNKKANAFWEASLNKEEKPVPDADRDTRQLFLQKKYKALLYAHEVKGEQATLDKKLLQAAGNNDLEDCMRLIYSGANLSHTGEDGLNAYLIAKSKGYSVLAEFLQQNSGYTKAGTKHPEIGGSGNGGNSPLPTQRRNDSHGRSFVRSSKDSKQEGIHKSGWLYKTGSNRRDFLRRYCVLEHGILTYYLDEKTSQQQNCIEGIEMVLVALSESKAGHKYCFEVVTTYGRAFLFAAETEIERREWMIALAKIHSIDSMWQSLQKFEFAGFLHKKDGAATTNWQRLWFILKGKSLMFYSVTNDSIDEIDLRKVVTLSTELPFMGNLASGLFLTADDNRRRTLMCKDTGRQDGSDRNSVAEFNQYISVVLPGKIVYLRAETKQASDAWFCALQKAAAHKGPALDEQQLTGENVPIIVSECLKFVATHDGLTTEGIYRLSGTSSVISRIVNLFAEDPRSVRLTPEEYTIHDVTGALKKYFRELPDPLMTQKLYKEWIDKAECNDHDRKLQWYYYLLGQMPTINYDTLKLLIGHLSSIAASATENKMYTKNLAAVFGPTLMASSDQSYHNTDKEIKVIADLIDYYTWLFGISDEEINKEKEIEEKYKVGLDKLREAQQAARQTEMDMDLLVEMYIGNKETGQSINIKLNRSQTADEILNQVVAQQQLPGDNWAMVEKICNGELERLFHGYEKVLVDIMAWNPQIAAGNYICIKENPLQPHISLYIKSMHAWNGILKYCEGGNRRKWNKYHFDLSNNVLTYYKDTRQGGVSQPLGGWKVADMKIYMGLEKKKNPPHEWGISFTVNAEHILRAICFEKQEDLYMWLGGLLKSKTDVQDMANQAVNSLAPPRNKPVGRIVDPSMLQYSPANLPPTPTRDKSNRKSKIPKIPFNWRRSRMPSIDDG